MSAFHVIEHLNIFKDIHANIILFRMGFALDSIVIRLFYRPANESSIDTFDNNDKILPTFMCFI